MTCISIHRQESRIINDEFHSAVCDRSFPVRQPRSTKYILYNCTNGHEGKGTLISRFLRRRARSEFFSAIPRQAERLGNNFQRDGPARRTVCADRDPHQALGVLQGISIIPRFYHGYPTVKPPRPLGRLSSGGLSRRQFVTVPPWQISITYLPSNRGRCLLKTVWVGGSWCSNTLSVVAVLVHVGYMYYVLCVIPPPLPQ